MSQANNPNATLGTEGLFSASLPTSKTSTGFDRYSKAKA